MMASPSELTLDCKPHSYSMLLKSVGEQSDQTQKLEEFLARLEEERHKIDAFKRELPLCMNLLTNAMEASRQQLQSYRANTNQGPKPVLEEFIPLKHPNSELVSEKAITNASDKANWMTSAQLWSQAGGEETINNKQAQSSPVTSPKESEMGFGVNLKQAFENKQIRNGGAFLPFSKDRNNSNSCGTQALRGALPELALASSPDKDMMDDKRINLETDHTMRKESSNSCRVIMNNGNSVMEQAAKAADSQTNTTTITNSSTITTTQTHRKARRCWSPDLHRRFVNALQMLGGSQVATPKQIRELMKVDGLTNDEVKSHLQKYRLHTRRPSPSSQAASAAAPQLVVLGLGGIWVPQEYATAAAHHGGGPATLYPSTHASVSPHYSTTPVPQEFYPAPTPPPPHHQLHHHHHPLHQQLHMYQQASQTQSSPESDVRGTGDRSESIEDGKSESSSWKADSNGENGGERKTLALREDGEESNGSEITLKF